MASNGALFQVEDDVLTLHFVSKMINEEKNMSESYWYSLKLEDDFLKTLRRYG